MYVIWHDKDYDFARWVYLNSNLSKIKEKVILRSIPKTNSKTTILKNFEDKTDYDILPVIKLETPDIIIQKIDEKSDTSKIIFVTEFMTHTPQHHHPLQRFSRIYCASELKIPVALVIPNTKIKLERKKGVYKPTKYKTNPLIYHIFLRTTKTNNNPTLIYLWPDKEGYLRYDRKHPTAPYINQQIQNWLSFLNKYIKDEAVNYLEENKIREQIKLMEKISDYNYLDQEKLVKKWDEIYKLQTIRIIKTNEAISEFNLDNNKLAENFLRKELTFIFEPKGLHSPSTPFRTDPYAGMLCAFDNLFCRGTDGIRTINLILRAENINYSETSFKEFMHEKENCPFLVNGISREMTTQDIENHLDNCPFTQSKQQRIYGEVADIIVFDDKIYYRENEDG